MNDLDLVVTVGTGGSSSTSGGASVYTYYVGNSNMAEKNGLPVMYDMLNNVEQVVIPAEVVGKQPCALS